CAGNSGEICGGFDALSLYEIVSDTTPPTDDPTPAPLATPAPIPTPEPVISSDDFELIGCVADDKGVRVMSEGPITEDTMSAEICFGICSGIDASYTHFGTQYGEECWCTGSL
ncbi:unnamed protein product, partial [Ectocarpus sp. 12 AP-2014]